MENFSLLTSNGLTGANGSDPNKSAFPFIVPLVVVPFLRGVPAFGGGATKI